MSPHRDWDSPTPSPASECAPPPEPKGGGSHTRLLVRGVEESQFRLLEKKLTALPTMFITTVICLRIQQYKKIFWHIISRTSQKALS